MAAPPAAGPVALRFRPVFDGQPLTLATRPYQTRQSETVTIKAFRFYLTTPEVEFTDGTRYRPPASYHLLDAEEEATLTVALPGAPTKPVRRLAFWVGVDSAASAAGALGGALDPVHGMYWAWQSGYINAKLEGHSPASPDPKRAFEYHVGGYRAPHATRRRVELAVADKPLADLTVLADAGRWLADTRLATTPSVVQPGPAAARLADAYARMFRVE